MKRIKPMQWSEETLALIREQGIPMARIKTPVGWRTRIKKIHGDTRGKCFITNITFARAFPKLFWYCEGLANGMPHAWLSPKYIGEEKADSPWVIDLTWLWLYPVSRVPFDKVDYIGFKFDGEKACDFLNDRLDKRDPTTTVCLLKYSNEWNLKELSDAKN